MFCNVNMTILALKHYSPFTFYHCYLPFPSSHMKSDIALVFLEKKTPMQFYYPIAPLHPSYMHSLKTSIKISSLLSFQVTKPLEYFCLLPSHAPAHHNPLILLRWFSFLNSRLLLEVSFLVHFSISRIFTQHLCYTFPVCHCPLILN